LFFPTHQDLFFSKNDPEDIRLGQVFKNYTTQPSTNDFLIFGYPDDEGIKLNGGRIGAALGPQIIRQFLYKMTLPEAYFQKNMQHIQFQDYGNLDLQSELYFRHEMAKNTLLPFFKNQTKIITLGGGHDYGYPDGAAFIQNYSSSIGPKPLIINFDAHLDVRSSEKNLNSGTPFYRLLTEFKNQFNLLEIGLQKQCNSVQHWQWAHEQGAKTISLDDITNRGWDFVWNDPMIKELKPDTPVFISFDIDALTASEAGGCSQAWATGLKTSECLQFLNQLYKKSNVRGLGIYEVSPPLDRDFQTSKTAALFAYNFIFNS
jgi:formiminoglutamase